MHALIRAELRASRVRVRAVHAGAAATEELARGLLDAARRWHATHDAQGLLVVRRLQMRAARPGHRADEEHSIVTALQRVAEAAYRPAVGPVPASATAVRFASEQELLDCLARDWQQGQVGQRWWWPVLLGPADVAAVLGMGEGASPRSAHGAVVQAARERPGDVAQGLDRRGATQVAAAQAAPRGAWGPATLLHSGQRVHAPSPDPAPAQARAMAGAVDVDAVRPSPAAQRTSRRLGDGSAPSPPAPVNAPAAARAASSRPAAGAADAVVSTASPTWRDRPAIRPGHSPKPSAMTRAARAVEDAAGGGIRRASQTLSDEQLNHASTTQPQPLSASRLRDPGLRRDRLIPSRRSAAPQGSLTSGGAPQETTAPAIAAAPARGGDARPDRGNSAPSARATALRPRPDDGPGIDMSAAVSDLLRPQTLNSAHASLVYLINAFIALELYADFSAPRGPELAMPPADLLALAGLHLIGPALRDDALWPCLAQLAGRDPSRPPGRGWQPDDNWCMPRAWIDPFDDNTSRRWRALLQGGRLQVVHPRGFVVLDEARTATAVQDRLEAAAHQFGISTPALQQTQAVPRRISAERRWRARFMPYLVARLHLALGTRRRAELRALFSQAGRIETSEERLDVHLSLDRLPVSVRIAGLDRNPGWVPALQRQLAFHYV